ncbi:hypothetical protein ACFU5Y_00805 [Streptomyces gardneri]|uniref:hypothetical protein n=1 Tax=Streptomyces gardneri TaxID=66892 RepID=UPI0036A43812
MTAIMTTGANAMMQTRVGAAGLPRGLVEELCSLLGIAANQDTSVRLGGSCFDVVVTSSGVQASAAVTFMDEVQGGCGPVVEDTRDGLFYWLVPPGTTSWWEPHTHAVCLGAPFKIMLPSLKSTTPPSTPGPYWLRPSASDCLVPAAPLWRILDQLRPEPTPHTAFADRLCLAP